MSALDDRRRLEELYLPPADEFVLVDVPDVQFALEGLWWADDMNDLIAGNLFVQAMAKAHGIAITRCPTGAIFPGTMASICQEAPRWGTCDASTNPCPGPS
jgi:hypothetical protein